MEHMNHKSEHALAPSSIQFQRQMSEMGLRGEGVPFQPQSLTVVPLNINWHPGTRSGQITAHSWHIILGCNMIPWYPACFYTVNACVGVTWGLDLSKKCELCSRNVMPHVETQLSFNRCRDVVTTVCPQSLIRHPPCCGLWSKYWGWALTGTDPSWNGIPFSPGTEFQFVLKPGGICSHMGDTNHTGLYYSNRNTSFRCCSEDGWGCLITFHTTIIFITD